MEYPLGPDRYRGAEVAGLRGAREEAERIAEALRAGEFWIRDSTNAAPSE